MTGNELGRNAVRLVGREVEPRVVDGNGSALEALGHRTEILKQADRHLDFAIGLVEQLALLDAYDPLYLLEVVVQVFAHAGDQTSALAGRQVCDRPFLENALGRLNGAVNILRIGQSMFGDLHPIAGIEDVAPSRASVVEF